MRHITAEEAKEIDRRAEEEFGISSIVLMENAGRSSSEIAVNMLRGKKEKLVVCLCGKGNNGGDGFVTCRYLLNKGITVHIFLIGNPKELKGDARINYTVLQRMGAEIKILETKDDFAFLKEKLKDTRLVIDAIFGIGLQGEVKGPYKTIIELINVSRKPVLAIDIPSGLDATEGRVLGTCVKATQTVTFGLPKTGFIKNDGPRYTGKIVVSDISIPRILLDKYSRILYR